MVKQKWMTGLIYFSMIALLNACTGSEQQGTPKPIPSATPSNSRDVTIEVINNGEESGVFQIGEIFAFRHREGFQIWTHQANFWQPGDEFNAGSLTVKIIFDDSLVVEPFVFWANGSIQEGENGNGYFLESPMNINISTSSLTLGEHRMMVQVTNPRGQIFDHSWDFVIKEREPARVSAPAVLVPTIEYLLENPHPTPMFFSQNSSTSIELDRFSPIGLGEGMCFTLSEVGLVSSNPDETETPFNFSKWHEIRISIDGTILENNQFGMESETPNYNFICFKTEFLAIGSHLAEISFNFDGKMRSHTWAFVIE
jgi:hypothetical protein